METLSTQKYKFEFTGNPNNGAAPQSLGALIRNFKKNFLEKEIEIVPGLTHNQYEVIKRTYFYIHNQFESGPTDENGDPKYFYDLVTDRNDQATKNINLDTKDCYIKAEGEGSVLKSWLLRREFMAYAKTSGFGMKLNELAEDLPDFGTVVWKKCKNEEGKVDVHTVELINLMNDPAAKKLQDGIVIERHMLTQSDMRGYKVWNQEKVESLIASGRTSAKVMFLDMNPNLQQGNLTRTDETTPFYEVYELWGEIPRWMYEMYETGGKKRKGANGLPAVTYAGKPGNAEVAVKNQNESVYVMAIVSGVDDGNIEQVLFCKEADRSKFPYKEVHFRRRKGRWLGVGNYELCFADTEKANEITNRFFASLRISLLHLYQTRDQLHVKNVLTDLLDGDVVVTKSELNAIPTELRGFAEYKSEIEKIEAKVDRKCSSFEVVTGESLPSNTPYKLGAQQLVSATKFFVFVRENCGLFLEQVFNEWLLPDFGASLTEAHILDIIDDAEDMEIYLNAKRKIYQYAVMKRYIIEHNQMPDPAQLQIAGQLIHDQIAKGVKQVDVEENYYIDQKYSLKTVITGENDAKKENLETIANLTQVAMSNPQGLQDPRLMKLVNYVLEQSGFSPLQINTINNTPTNPSLNPANQGGGGADRAAGAGGQPVPSEVVPGRGPAMAGAGTGR